MQMSNAMQQMIVNMLKSMLGDIDLEGAVKGGIEQFQVFQARMSRIEQNQERIISMLESMTNDDSSNSAGDGSPARIAVG